MQNQDRRSSMRRILFVASESYPFVKTGGLADVVGALPKMINKDEFDVRVVIPKYMCIPWEYRQHFQYVTSFYMDLGHIQEHKYVGIMMYEFEGIKYYFIDNGLLSLQLLQPDTILLENVVALSLFRKYGHDPDNERVYFYNSNIEVDFYVPDDELAIQVSYSITDEHTKTREANALGKLPNVYKCSRRIIVTFDEQDTITDKHGTIEVIPCWKWLLDNDR